jgi:hypothetical protein
MKETTVASGAIATVTATGAQTAVAVSTEDDALLACVASTVTTGATFTIEGRSSTRDGAGSWIQLQQFTIAASGTYAIRVFSNKQRHLRRGKTIDEWRVNCIARTDGSYVFTSQKSTY